MIEKFELGILPSQDEWNAHIDLLRKRTTPSTKEALKAALIKAVKKRIPKEQFGLFLSGGVDSSFIALVLKQFTSNFVCYSVGFDGRSSDVEMSKKLADILGLDLRFKLYSQDEVLDFMR